MMLIVAILVGLIPLIPAVIFFLRDRRNDPSNATRKLVFGLNGFNAVVGLMVVGIGVLWLVTPSTVIAVGLEEVVATTDPFAALAAAISTGVACIGCGIAVASTGAAAIGVIAEKPESFGRSLIFVGMAEGIAIYGLIISFMILNR
ncbi:MAG: ATP synthase subunit C [Anaerolineaceae bacterium]|nr:ATP synthase subunit C [Anaerolineaceae bacterium]